MKNWNFSAGPAALAPEVLQRAQRELGDWHSLGFSVAEISHRSSDFLQLYRQTLDSLRRVMQISSDYEVLLLPGGARGMFAAIPMNLGGGDEAGADYVVSGHWSRAAWQQGSNYLQAAVAVDCGAYRSIPPEADWHSNEQARYCHYCPNETIHGLRFPTTPRLKVPLVADASSMLLTEALNIDDFGLVYACAQKNLGIAGVTLLIVRQDLLGNEQQQTPEIWHFARQAAKESMLNTPPTLAIYFLRLTLDWFEQQGGMEHFEALNQRKSSLLYDYIDASSGFYRNQVEPEFRSRVNIPFSTGSSELDDKFIDQANEAGLLYLRGHRAVGGMRASMYNALPLAAAEDLVQFMDDFSKRNK